MEKEIQNVEGDRDSPLAKTQRLGDMSPPVPISESHKEEGDLEHEIVEKRDLNVSQPLVASPSDLSNSQLDGQADHEEERTTGQNDFEENQNFHVAPKSATIVDKTQAEEHFVEVEKSKTAPVETSSNYFNSSLHCAFRLCKNTFKYICEHNVKQSYKLSKRTV